jgi:hypothetical protein
MDGRNRTRRSIGMIAALVLAVGTLGIGIASGQTSGDTYTGCLRQNGRLVKVAIGSAPTLPCAGTAVQASWNETGPEGPAGPQGAQGTQGPQGERGPRGLAGVSGYEIVTNAQTTTSSTFTFVDATCPDGKNVLGGGASARRDIGPFFTGWVVTQDFPAGDSGWTAWFDIENPAQVPVVLTTYAICANVG